MATDCAPGYQGPASDSKNDTLHVGCWAESKDGSLLFVKGVEPTLNRVIFSLYDMSASPIMDFTDSMPIDDFKEFFSWGSVSNKKVKDNKWTWHDKTPFPWSKVVKSGARDGSNFASAADLLSQAARVSQALSITGQTFSKNDVGDFVDKTQVRKLHKKFGDILKSWPKDK